MKTTSSPAYAKLLAEHLPAMPKNEAENQRLIQILEAMSEKNRHLNAAETLFFETVIALVLQYEDKASPMPVVLALDMLHHLVEEKGLPQADFVEEFGGSRAYVNQVFKGTRSITPNLTQKLAKVLKVTPQTLLPNLSSTPARRPQITSIPKSALLRKGRSSTRAKAS